LSGLTVHPVLLGTGQRLFAEADSHTTLALTGSHAFGQASWCWSTSRSDRLRRVRRFRPLRPGSCRPRSTVCRRPSRSWEARSQPCRWSTG